jgi:hypothetical protein
MQLGEEMQEAITEIGGELDEIEKWVEDTKALIELHAIQHELRCINLIFTKLRSRVSVESEEAKILQQWKANKPSETKKRFIFAAV